MQNPLDPDRNRERNDDQDFVPLDDVLSILPELLRRRGEFEPGGFYSRNGDFVSFYFADKSYVSEFWPDSPFNYEEKTFQLGPGRIMIHVSRDDNEVIGFTMHEVSSVLQQAESLCIPRDEAHTNSLEYFLKVFESLWGFNALGAENQRFHQLQATARKFVGRPSFNVEFDNPQQP